MSVRQDLCGQKLQKGMTSDRQQIELLECRVQELRYRLASRTEFTRLESGVESRGLRPAHSDQVLAAVTGTAIGQAAETPADLAGRLVAGLVEFLGPQAAQADAPTAESPEDAGPATSPPDPGSSAGGVQ